MKVDDEMFKSVKPQNPIALDGIQFKVVHYWPTHAFEHTGQSIYSERFRLKFCRENVILREFWLCCFSRQNFKWNPWLPMLFRLILDQPPTRLFLG